jgi:hypothetical protein
LRNPRTDAEIAETLEDVQTALEVLIEHAGLESHVRLALEARKAKAERSRLEIERSLGQGPDAEGESRR